MRIAKLLAKLLLIATLLHANYNPIPAYAQGSNYNININISRPIQLFLAASFYADKFEGRIMANGKVFHQKNLTIASRTLPLGTVVKITSMTTGNSVIATVTDRGPYSRFDVDVSTAIFLALGLPLTKGWDWVTVEIAPKC